jgi:tetratricopeptide (TPR) repeat protein
MTVDHPIDSLYSQAQKALDKFEPKIALEFLKRIYQQEPTHSNATQVALILIQISNYDEAIEYLRNSIRIDADESRAYFPLAQLLNSMEALEFYLTGIDKLRNKVSNRILSSAYCAVVELYMTELWYFDAK